MKTCYFVCGAESSGNRLMARLLIEAGCYGDGDVVQRLDNYIPTGIEHLVWIRSFPHGAFHENRHWPDLAQLRSKVGKLGYRSQFIIMQRDWFCTARSQIENGHVKTMSGALQNIAGAYLKIYSQLVSLGVPYYAVVYESLVKRGQKLTGELFPLLGLPQIEVSEYLYDGNEKWYG